MMWNLDPVILAIGPLEIRWYGLIYALGFLLGYFVLAQAAKHKRVKGFAKKDAENLLFWIIVGSILFSRLVYVFIYDPAHFLANPGQIIQLWQGGLSIHGGLLGAVLAIWLFCMKRRISFLETTDVLAAPLAFALVFGRLANYTNGELWGRLTDVSWCVTFPGAEGCRHPSQLYEAVYGLVLFVILAMMENGKRLKRGIITWTFILLYGLFRFFVTFLREFDPQDPALLGISIGQWLSLLMVAVGAIGLWSSHKRF